jgi:hypothetical protein
MRQDRQFNYLPVTMNVKKNGILSGFRTAWIRLDFRQPGFVWISDNAACAELKE